MIKFNFFTGSGTQTDRWLLNTKAAKISPNNCLTFVIRFRFKFTFNQLQLEQSKIEFIASVIHTISNYSKYNMLSLNRITEDYLTVYVNLGSIYSAYSQFFEV